MEVAFFTSGFGPAKLFFEQIMTMERIKTAEKTRADMIVNASTIMVLSLSDISRSNSANRLHVLRDGSQLASMFSLQGKHTLKVMPLNQLLQVAKQQSIGFVSPQLAISENKLLMIA